MVTITWRNRSNSKKFFIMVFVFCLITYVFGTSRLYAATPDKVQSAAERMLKLHLVNGVTPGADVVDLALNANITRAQLVTLLVRAFGQEGNAKYLSGAAAYPDTANHPWASGNIAMAKRIIAERSGGKEVVGLPNGTFNPDGNVTSAEAIAFMMKFVGAPKDESLPWPDNYIQGALNAGLITADDKAVLDGSKNAPATRGLAFYLADRTFYGYKLAEGGTVYTTFVDSVKPALTVDSSPATTLEETVTITGVVSNDAVAVYAGSTDHAATIANGKFAATVELKIGENVLLVTAVDLAGNRAEQSVTITRAPKPAAIEVSPADLAMRLGDTQKFTIVVKDAEGKQIENAAVTWQADGGTIDSSAVYQATRVGDYSITFKSGEVVKTVKVSVRSRPIVPSTIGTSDTPVNLVAGRAAEWTFTVYDQYGRPFNGAAVRFGVTGSLNSGGLSVDSARTDANGQVIVSYRDGIADHTGTITASIENAGIQKATGTIVVIALSLTLSDVQPTIVTVGQSVYATSNENGYVYLVTDIVDSPTLVQLENAVTTGVKVAAIADISVTINTTGLLQGEYSVFAVNSAGQVSDAVSIHIVNPTPPVLSEVTVRPVTVGGDVHGTSDKSGWIYLVPSTVGSSPTQTTLEQANGVKTIVSAYQEATMHTSGLTPGIYSVFAVDLLGNVSAGVSLQIFI